MFPTLDSVTSVQPTARSQPTGAPEGQTITTTTTTVQAHHTNSPTHFPRAQSPDGTLRLRGGPIHSRRVTWSEEVVDNEGLGRKKSKVCCIFKRNQEFGESSDESSSSSDSSDSSDDSDIGDDKREGNVKRGCDKDYEHDDDHDDDHDHSYHHEYRKPGRRRSRRPPSPNAYEKMPKNVMKKREGISATMTQS
ncbi:type 1 phosphatases regulator YPI1 [Tirmania nivea]|nr:type 1 phosphatases regulator YPI1 [Tirmania nivea]